MQFFSVPIMSVTLRNPLTLISHFVIASHHYAQHKIRPIATIVAWSVSVCLLDALLSCAKSAEQIRVLFGGGTRGKELCIR